MKIEKFNQLVKADAEKRIAVQGEIADLIKREAALKAEIKAAAEADDLAAFRAKKKDLEEVSETLQVKRTYLDHATLPVTEADARDVWSDYSEQYNKNMAKALAEFASLRDKLVAAYLTMVEMQNDACRTREGLCDVLGINNPDRAFPMQYIPVRAGVNELGLVKKGSLNATDPDFVYVAACLEVKAGKNIQLAPNTAEAKTVEKAAAVVINHRSK